MTQPSTTSVLLYGGPLDGRVVLVDRDADPPLLAQTYVIDTLRVGPFAYRIGLIPLAPKPTPVAIASFAAAHNYTPTECDDE